MVNALEIQINDNWQRIQAKIANAAARSHRNSEDIRVVTVSKLQPVLKIMAAVNCGITEFGENYPEQAIDKIHLLQDNPDVHWHMIGRLQSRKAKIVVSDFDMFHALDSVKIAQKLEKQLAEIERTLPVLMEVNVGGEESKAGWNLDDIPFEEWVKTVFTISRLPHLKLIGLMTMPPFHTKPEASRIHFIRLRETLEHLQAVLPEFELNQLSMGTSQDYEVAVEEGATLVRIGTAILGKRN